MKTADIHDPELLHVLRWTNFYHFASDYNFAYNIAIRTCESLRSLSRLKCTLCTQFYTNTIVTLFFEKARNVCHAFISNPFFVKLWERKKEEKEAGRKANQENPVQQQQHNSKWLVCPWQPPTETNARKTREKCEKNARAKKKFYKKYSGAGFFCGIPLASSGAASKILKSGLQCSSSSRIAATLPHLYTITF